MKEPYRFRVFASALVILALLFSCPASGLMVSVSTFPSIISGKEATVDLSQMITGGTPPYICTLAHSSTLPEGLVLLSNCIISGRHTVASSAVEEVSSPFTIMVTDSGTPSASTSFTIPIMTRAIAPVLIPKNGQCTEKTPCSTPVAGAWRGTPPFHYKSGSFADGGAPPMGMIVDLNGNLNGNAPAAGTYTFSVCVVDSIGESDCGQASVVVSPAATPSQKPGAAGHDLLSDFIIGFVGMIENALVGAGLIPEPDLSLYGSSPVITPSATSTPARCPGGYPYYYDGDCHAQPPNTPSPKITPVTTFSGMCVASIQMGRCNVEFCSDIGPNGQMMGYYHTSRGNFYCSGSGENMDCGAAATKMAQACI